MEYEGRGNYFSERGRQHEGHTEGLEKRTEGDKILSRVGGVRDLWASSGLDEWIY
jgi:hypothetical protein